MESSTLIDCLSQQLSEIELLTCMYPNKDDIILTDRRVLNDIKACVEKKTNLVPNHLEFSLFLHIDDLKLEVSINLPSFYPEEEPDIYVRCNQLNGNQQTTLNSDLSLYLKDNHSREQCLYGVISWIQENIEKYNETENPPQVNTVETKNNEKEQQFARLWIFSHHIYNKKKREEILKESKEHHLTGFCLPGKPGVICIEGFMSDCNDWWKIIKSLTWKKIGIRKIDIFNILDRSREQRFQNFEELHFVNPSSKQSKHANMSEFSKYIENLGLTQDFNDVFGLCNNNT